MNRAWSAGLLILCAGACVLTGCTTISGRMYEIGPETHFVYPNSNVRMLGPVNYTFKSPRTFGFPEISMTGKEELKFYNAALAQVPGANVITDYVRIITFKSLIIYPPIMFFWTEFTIQGTAARMTVGEQEIGGETGTERPRVKAPSDRVHKEEGTGPGAVESEHATDAGIIGHAVGAGAIPPARVPGEKVDTPVNVKETTGKSPIEKQAIPQSARPKTMGLPESSAKVESGAILGPRNIQSPESSMENVPSSKSKEDATGQWEKVY